MQNADNPKASRRKLPKKDVVMLVPKKIHTDQGVLKRGAKRDAHYAQG